MNGSARLALCVAIALSLSGCGPATSHDVVNVELGEVSADGSHVTVRSIGRVCSDFEMQLHRSDSIIIVSGTGRVPDNDDGLCSKYLDTSGGEGTTPREASSTLRLDPGSYTVRNLEGTSAIEFQLGPRGFTSSFPYSTMKEFETVVAQRLALQPQRVSSAVLAAEVESKVATTTALREETRCEYLADMTFLNTPADDPNLTICTIDSGALPTVPDSGPFNALQLADFGCVGKPVEVDLDFDEWDVSCSLERPDLAIGGDEPTLRIRAHYRDGSGPHVRLWLAPLSVWVE
jgi:hypothetical protein